MGLFPSWFDFAPHKFAVLAFKRGLHLIVSGAEYGFAIISTSDSRCISCIYLGTSSIESARMDMHYEPRAEQTERARVVLELALFKLFPGHGDIPKEIALLIPEGHVFPPSWSDRSWSPIVFRSS